jgi:hypothetical protein
VPETLVERDGTGSFAAATVTLDQTLHFSGAASITEFGAPVLVDEAGNGFLFSSASSLDGTQASDNIGLGYSALSSTTTGSRNVAVGTAALSSTQTGAWNTAVGTFVLQKGADVSGMVAVGTDALMDLESGNSDTAVGASALESALSGDSNTSVGQRSLSCLISGTQNVAIGDSAGINYTTAESNNVDIASPGVIGDWGAIRIGTAGAQTSVYIAGINGTSISNGTPVVVDSNGQLGVSTTPEITRPIGGGPERKSDGSAGPPEEEQSALARAQSAVQALQLEVATLKAARTADEDRLRQLEAEMAELRNRVR